MTILKETLRLLLFVSSLVLLPLACDRDRGNNQVDETMEKIEDAGDEVKDKVEDAGDEVKDKVEDAGDEVKDKLDDAGDR